MATDEELVAAILAQYELIAARPDKDLQRAGKTPDFLVKRDDTDVFWCEVKSAQEALDKAPAGTVGEDDPTYNRVSKKIHEAVKQFDAVNPDRTLPNVLFFVNHERRSDPHDLQAVFTGELTTAEGKSVPAFGKYSDGRIRGEKWRVDLYVWLDVPEGGPLFRFNVESPHYRNLCGLFGADPDRLPVTWRAR